MAAKKLAIDSETTEQKEARRAKNALNARVRSARNKVEWTDWWLNNRRGLDADRKRESAKVPGYLENRAKQGREARANETLVEKEIRRAANRIADKKRKANETSAQKEIRLARIRKRRKSQKKENKKKKKDNN